MTPFDEEIDLRPYLQVLVSRWLQISLISIAFSVVVASLTLLSPQSYEATASVLLTRTRPSLELAEQFPTVYEPIDSGSRMDAILTISKGDAILVDVYTTHQAELTELGIDLFQFQENASVRNIGDSVLFTYISESPQLSATIANEWARTASLVINRGFRGEQPLSLIQNQLVSARDDYVDAQDKLENFLSENQITLLEIQISEAREYLTELTDDRATLIAFYDQRKDEMEALIVTAQALRNQLERGSNSTAGNLGDAIAVFQARANGMGLDPLPQNFIELDFQLQDPNQIVDNPSNYIADMDELIEQAILEKTLAEEALTNLGEAIIAADSENAIDVISNRLRELETNLEREKSRSLELTSERDLAWQAYQALAQKEAEIRNAPQSDDLVSLVGPAIPPEKPTPRGLIVNTLIAGFVGGILSTSWIILRFWWRSEDGEPPPSS